MGEISIVFLKSNNGHVGVGNSFEGKLNNSDILSQKAHADLSLHQLHSHATLNLMRLLSPLSGRRKRREQPHSLHNDSPPHCGTGLLFCWIRRTTTPSPGARGDCFGVAHPRLTDKMSVPTASNHSHQYTAVSQQ